MNAQSFFQRRISRVLVMILILPVISPAQLISLKTAPVAAGNQFLLFPSRNLGMGGVSIAVEDPLADTFVNPAKGARLTDVHFFGAPTFYNVSDNQGAARTLPLGTVFGGGKWFGGISLAVQQLQAAEPPVFFGVQPTVFVEPGGEAIYYSPLKEQNANNFYISGILGTRLPGSDISLAAGLFWAELEAVDGVDLLYPRSQDIRQYGHSADFRVGISAELSGHHSFEALLLYNDFDMTHDVAYLKSVPLFGENDFFQGIQVERNLDRTYTWGMHFGYTLPLPGEEWRMGGILTANRKTHPKIPNYELMNIPRDPGESYAFNIGAGVSRMVDGAVVFGADFIFEPAWSHTWAEAAEPLQTPGGKTIFPGQKTVDNRFTFSNWKLRIGIGEQGESFGLQLGMQVSQYRYWLEQTNFVEEIKRKQKEYWYEWTPGLGLRWKFSRFELQYTGQLTLGTGRPGIASSGVVRTASEIGALGNDFLIAPSGELALDEAILLTHQISVVIPL